MSQNHSSVESDGRKSKYKEIKCLGKGTSGEVYLCEDKTTHKYVADKRIVSKRINGKDYGINGSGIREIKILKESDQENIIKMHDVFYETQYLHVVLEYCCADLKQVIYHPEITLSSGDIKRIFLDCLTGLAYCHQHYILHRDIKPENILISFPDYKHKITDFGLSTYFASPRLKYTHHVCTSPYRAPELCLHASSYGPAVDIWSMGMVFAEVLLHGRLIQVETDNDYQTLAYIFHVFGVPDDDTWPGVSQLDAYLEEMANEKGKEISWKKLFPTTEENDQLLLDLLSKMFVLDPQKRISAKDALQHPYFTCEPKPTPSEQLPYEVLEPQNK